MPLAGGEQAADSPAPSGEAVAGGGFLVAKGLGEELAGGEGADGDSHGLTQLNGVIAAAGIDGDVHIPVFICQVFGDACQCDIGAN